MIKCNVTLCGKIFISAQEKTSKDGQKFLSFGVSIPMKGKITSLNASNAAAILMYEVIRQRDGKAVR